jgi:hypothetical protein
MSSKTAAVKLVNFTKGIIVIPTQGVGNRLRMIASSYTLSRLWKLPLYICWENTNDCNASLHDIFGPNIHSNVKISSISTAQFTQSSYLYFGPIHTESIFNYISYIPQPLHYNTNQVDIYEYMVITGGHEFKHPEMELFDFIFYKHQFYNGLQFNQSIIDRVFSETSIITQKYIAIHIRDIDPKYDTADIDYRNSSGATSINPLVFTKNSPLDKYCEYIDMLDPNIPLRIITNSSDMNTLETIFQSKYPDRTIHFSNSDINGRDSVQGIVDGIVDMVIMSKARLIIGNYYSSFSDESAFFDFIPKITPLSEELEIQLEKSKQYYHCYNYKMVKYKSKCIYGLNLDLYHIFKYLSKL